MFERAKERIKKLEETNENVHKVMAHLRTNKKSYYVGASCLGVGFVGGKYFQRPIEVTVENIIENTPVFNNTVAPVMNNVGNQMVNNIGYCCKIVQDVDNPDKLWAKIQILAEEISEREGVSVGHVRNMLNKHFRGELEHVFNKHYRPYGVTTTH